MENSLLYIVTVLIWGSTWLAITFQLGVVPPELSVAYRFFLAALLLFIYSKWRGLKLRFTLREQGFIVLQGLLLFSVNYILVYFSEIYINSGMVSVLFSSVIVFNVFFGAVLLRNPVRSRVLLGSLVGIAGLALIFWPELESFDLQGGQALGLILALVSAVSASLGNIVSARNQRNKLPVIQTNAYGMLYGAIFTSIIAIVRGVPLTFDLSAGYVGSLLYLSIFGSVIAFGTYLTLLGRIGADRAAYVTVLFPVIALLLSAAFEGLRLDWTQFGGVALVLLGNGLVVNLRQQRGAVPAAAK
ncbi:MAG: EamA family transporter [Anaerolineales bacterium]